MEKETKIELAGFNCLDEDLQSVAKRLVNNFVKKTDEHNNRIDELTLTLKEVHKTKKNAKFELKGKININGKISNSKAVDHNFFFALRDVLNKLQPKQEG